MYQHIVVAAEATAFDLPAVEHAVEHAAALARAVGARLTLLHIVPDAHRELSSGNDLSVSAESIEREWEESAGRVLQTEGEGSGLDIWRLQRPARGRDVPHALLDEAAELGADLLVLGTHGRRGWQQFLQGSVATSVLQRSRIPLLLLRRG